MKNRAQRRENTQNKFISRIKEWFQIEGKINNKTWVEYLKNNRWLNKHKHNKVWGRSTYKNMIKKQFHKDIRQEQKKEINQFLKED